MKEAQLHRFFILQPKNVSMKIDIQKCDRIYAKGPYSFS